MRIELTTRGLLSAFFRQRWKFLMVFLAAVLGSGAYAMLAEPLYQAGGSLLVRFGTDTTQELTRAAGAPQIISQNDRREIMQSNADILQSHNLLRAVVLEIGAEKLYPGISARVAGKDLPEEAAILRLWKSDLTVKSTQQSNIIDIYVRNTDPQVATLLTKTLMEFFIARQSEVFNKPHAEFLDAQIAQAAEKLEKSQAALREFKATAGISSLEDELNELLKQKTEATAVALKSVDDARARLSEVQAEELALLTTYRPNSPQVLQVREKVALAERQLAARQAELRGISGKSGAAAATINKRIEALEKNRNTYNDLVRQVEIDEANYKNYKLRGEEARVGETLNQKSITPISVVDEPTVPMKPIRPRKRLILAIGLLAGLVLGAGLVLAAETIDQRFTTPEHITQALGLPVMATFNSREA